MAPARLPAASTIPQHHAAAQDGAPSGTMVLSLAPPSGPMQMQQNLIDLNVLPILEFDPTQSQASGGIDDANMPVTAHEYRNLPLSQSISAPSFQDFSSLAPALSRGTSHPESSDRAPATSNVTHGLPESDLLIGRFPELELLTGSEEHMLHQLLPKEHPQGLENARSVSPPQEHHPNCSPEPTQEAQLAICTNTPSSVGSASVQNGSTNSASTVDDGITAQSVQRWPHCGQANRYPKRPIAARVQNPCVAVAVPPMRFGINEIPSPRPSQYVTPRANRLWSECEQRMKLRDDIIRTRPPSDALKTWLENEAKLLIEMMKHVRLCEEMEAVEVAIKHLQAVAGSTWVPNWGTNMDVLPNRDASAMAAVTTFPASGIRLSQASMLSTNVTLLVNTHSCFLTTTSPQDQSSGLLDHIVSTLREYRLEVLSVTFVTRENTIVYSLHFQVRQHEQVLLEDLFSALQTIVNNFSLATPSRGRR